MWWIRTGVLVGILGCSGCTTEDVFEDGTHPKGDRDSDSDTDVDADADADADADVEPDTGDDADADGGPEPHDLFVDPPEIDFGAVPTASPAEQIVHIENIGSEAVHLNGLGSSDSSVFTFITDFAVPITFPPGMEKTMIVTFTPGEAVTYVGEITFITEEVLADDADISLQGSGDAPPCEICDPIITTTTSGPTDTHLRLTNFLGCSADGIVTVQNIGDRPLAVTSVVAVNDIIFSCGTFTASSPVPMTLPPMGTMGITVTYTGTSACIDEVVLSGEENKLHILSNDPSAPDYVVNLSGEVTCLF